MVPHPLIDVAFQSMGIALIGIVCVCVYRAGLYRVYPVFTTFIALQGCRDLLLGIIHYSGSYADYFYAYWSLELLSTGLEFAVLYELFAVLLEDYDDLRAAASSFFKWTAAVLLAIAWAASLHPAADYTFLMQFIFSFEMAVRIVQCGLVLMLVAMSRSIALRWGHYGFGVLLGFGVMAFLGLIAVGLRTKIGITAGSEYFWLKPASYLVGAGIWASYLLHPAAKRKVAPAALRSDDLQRWNASVARVWGRGR